MKKIVAIAFIFGIQSLIAQQNKIETKELEINTIEVKEVDILDEDFNVAVPNEQPDERDENAIYNAVEVEQLPAFPGGIQAFYNYFAAKFKMPADEPNLKGKIFVGFVVEKDGSLSSINVYRDLGFGTGKEAIRVLKGSPKWLPGIHKGKSVRVKYSLPITINAEQSKTRKK